MGARLTGYGLVVSVTRMKEVISRINRARSLGIRRSDANKRFMAMVKKTPGCWWWTGALNAHGYGVFRPYERTKQFGAHRYSYLLHRGPLTPGLVIDHLCGEPTCVNPHHLEEVTVLTNCLRSRSPAAENARKTHCKYGHPFSGVNLGRGKNANGRPKRVCRTCAAAAQKPYRAKIKALSV